LTTTDDRRLRRRFNAAATFVLLLCAALFDHKNGFRWSMLAANAIADRVFKLRIAFVDADLPAYTRVEVYALSPKENRVGRHRDWERLAHAALSGADLEKFKSSWRALDFGAEYSTACHNPAYRLQFYRDDLLEFDTTVSWECGNITVWGAEFGFDAKSADAQALFRQLQAACPAPAR
jgi:hypothetical protein